MDNFDDNNSDEGGEFEYDPTPFYTDEVFSSQEQLTEWAQSTAIPLGYVLVKGRSNKNSAGYTTKVLLMCDRGGVPRDRGSTGARAAFSKKCNCPFKLQGYFDPLNGWRVNVKEHRHNHVPLQNLAEYDTNKDFYDSVFAVERVHKSVQMSYPDGGRPRDYWMSMPEGPILLVNRLGLVINCLSLDESSTVFPFWRGPDSEMYRNQPISIALVHRGSHYVMVELEGKYPMARLNPYWSHQNITPGASRWKDHYKDQFDLYVRLSNSY